MVVLCNSKALLLLLLLLVSLLNFVYQSLLLDQQLLVVMLLLQISVTVALLERGLLCRQMLLMGVQWQCQVYRGNAMSWTLTESVVWAGLLRSQGASGADVPA